MTVNEIIDKYLDTNDIGDNIDELDEHLNEIINYLNKENVYSNTMQLNDEPNKQTFFENLYKCHDIIVAHKLYLKYTAQDNDVSKLFNITNKELDKDYESIPLLMLRVNGKSFYELSVCINVIVQLREKADTINTLLKFSDGSGYIMDRNKKNRVEIHVAQRHQPTRIYRPYRLLITLKDGIKESSYKTYNEHDKAYLELKVKNLLDTLNRQ